MTKTTKNTEKNMDTQTTNGTAPLTLSNPAPETPVVEKPKRTHNPRKILLVTVVKEFNDAEEVMEWWNETKASERKQYRLIRGGENVTPQTKVVLGKNE